MGETLPGIFQKINFPKKLTRKRKAELILLSITLIWGATFSIVKSSLSDVSPLFFIGIRFIIASVFLLIFFSREIKNFTQEELYHSSILGILLFLGFAAQTIGLLYTSASKSAFLTGMAVIFTPLFQFLIERKAPLLGNVIGVIIVSVGLYFLTSPKGSEFNFGDGLTIACAIIFALYIVYVDIATQTSNPLRITFLQILINGVLSLFLALIFEDIRFKFSSNVIFALIYLSLLATVLTLYLQMKWQKETTPTKAAVIFTLEPVIAAILAYLFLGENIGLLGVIGGATILFGLILSEISDDIPILNYSLNLNTKVENKIQE